MAFAGVVAVAAAAIAVAGRLGTEREQGGLATALEWARLEELPQSATDLRVTASGNSFSRTIEVRFTGEPADIARWLGASPGTAAVEPSVSDGITRFKVDPGGGANVAIVEVNDSTDEVYIFTSWS